MAFRSQEEIFYDARWTPAMERRFISELRMEMYDNGGLKTGLTAEMWWPFIERVTWEMNLKFKVHNDEEFYEEKLMFLEQRYNTFNWVKEQPDVQWINSWKIEASDETFRRLMQTKPLAEAYRTKGEDEFYVLQKCLGVDPENPPEWDIDDFPEVQIRKMAEKPEYWENISDSD